jgi:hypothetical protein
MRNCAVAAGLSGRLGRGRAFQVATCSVRSRHLLDGCVRNYRVGGTTKAIDEDAATVNDPATDGETDDHKIFQKLANFVLGRLSIAHSTAVVERTFSIVSCVESKLRNRMSTSTLEAGCAGFEH